MKSLVTKVALVTGGNKGIGPIIVKKLAEGGATVAFTYCKGTAKAKDLEAEIIESRFEAIAIKTNTSSNEEIKAAIDQIIAKYGRIDILVNCAGSLIPKKTPPDASEEILAKIWQRSLFGAAQMVNQLTPYLSDGGRIITIGSYAEQHSGFVFTGNYATARETLAIYNRYWSQKLAKKNITVNIVQPSLIDTLHIEGITERILDTVSLKRFGKPHDVGNIVFYLASKKGSYISGATFTIDGGLYA
jgi:3-oxoacyl-[acyl-carrier protein] reductase